MQVSFPQIRSSKLINKGMRKGTHERCFKKGHSDKPAFLGKSDFYCPVTTLGLTPALAATALSHDA